MEKRRQVTFDVYTLDSANESLWKGSERIHLRPKSFALLQYLVDRPGQLVTKDQLFNALWQDRYVEDGALKHCMAEIRKALSDPAETPRFIETAHRRGYRFIGDIDSERTVHVAPWTGAGQKDQGSYAYGRQLVGRTIELAQLQQSLERAIEGVRQVVFVTGEQGIGKTTLVDAFLKSVNPTMTAPGRPESHGEPWVARGQCIKSHGASEAYMPFWEAFIELYQKTNRKHIVATLHQHAPLWLMQMPSLVSAAQLRNLQRITLGATRERMLREMAEALEILTAENPLILVLEDLHWSDYSTLDLISFWAQRRAPARLLLIGTYRPAEAMANDNPLRTIKQELQAHHQCQELPLGFLGKDAIEEYLLHRFPNHGFPAEMAPWIHRRTEGSPLFVINLLDHLVARGLIAQHGKEWTLNVTLDEAELDVPPTIQQIVGLQIERCSAAEQSLLQAASIVGVDFSAATVAAALGEKADRIETLCRDLIHRHLFLQPASIRQLQGGKREAHYRFGHVVYQNICYQLLPQELRAQMHRRIAKHIERTNPKQLGDLATRLAMHFEQGRDYSRAIKYYRQAAANANWRYAGREAQKLAHRGIQLLKEASSGLERAPIEMSLQIELGTALLATRGLGTEEVKNAFARAQELLRQLNKRWRSDNNDLLFSALWGLWNYNWIRAEYAAARKAADRMLQLAEAEQDSIMLTQAHYALGIIMMDHGEFHGALQHLEQCPTVVSRIYAAVTLWNLGFPDRAMKSIEDTLARVLTDQNPEDVIFTYVAAARVHVARGESEKALDRTQAALGLARQHNFLELWLAPWKIIGGWALTKLGQKTEGIKQIHAALVEYQEAGFTNIRPYLSVLFAETLGDAGQIEEGLIAVQDALDAACKTGIRHHEAEIYRIKGELLLKRALNNTSSEKNPKFAEAESCLKRAIVTARKQQAKSFELRATVNLARMLQKRNQPAPAIKLLTKIYSWFTEGHDTFDLREARTLLQELKAL
jgi:DNA-binding winged helix-turn-helix (wHTH) protein